MRRAGIVAAGIVGVLGIAGAGVWLALFRDTAEPVTVGDAVTSFRTDTEATPAAPSPISPGVYVYATRGYEKTDALTGVTHRYPRRSTITVTAADCGVRLTWRVLKGRSTAWTFCVSGDGWKLRTQDERHAFFGRTEATTYVCDHALIWARSKPVGSTWPVGCSTGDATETGTSVVVGRLRFPVGATRTRVTRMRKLTRFSGAIRGTARYDFWFDDGADLLAKIAMLSRTTNDSPVGDVHYEEDVTLVLTSLKPRR